MASIGDRVELNADGVATFPSYVGRAAEVVGFQPGGMVKLRFDGKRTVVPLHPDFLQPSTKPREPDRRSVRPSREAQAIERRRVLRGAFDLVRNNPAEMTYVDRLARALGGREPATRALLERAKQTIGVST